MIKLEKMKYYWVKVDGYDLKYRAFLFNGTSWKISFHDSDKFISSYKLELLFGKDCVIREVNFEKDIDDGTIENDLDMKLSFVDAFSLSDDGRLFVTPYIPVFGFPVINGKIIPQPNIFDDIKILKFTN
tara:strand:+ start:242 stop:628 length:387 start_codon:yes stop_codon:yes gene_type:complete